MSSKQQIVGIAVFNEKKVKGQVLFIEDLQNNCIIINVDVSGLSKNSLHGFHIHKFGDMSDHCESMCEHFNPYGNNHGGPDMKMRHVGDLGNLKTDKNGCVKHIFADKMIKLRGTKCNIIGRGLIIHEDEDDLGLGNTPNSLTTGNSGKRIACAVIGYSRKTYT
jgi:Cu-Zn family superoxide dismutase